MRKWLLLKLFGALLVFGGLGILALGELSLPSKMSSAHYHFAGVSLALLSLALCLIGVTMYCAAHQKVQKMSVPQLACVVSSMVLLGLATTLADLY